MQHTRSCCSSRSGKHQDSLPKSMMASARVSYTAWGRRLGRGRLRRGHLRRGRLGRRGGGTQAVQHRHRRHLLVSLAACSLAFTAASGSALSRAAATLRSLRGPPPRPPSARYESAAACCSAATDALLIRRVAHRTWPPSCVFLRGDL